MGRRMGDQLEKIATTHESISALLHAIDPRILIHIACAAAGIEVGELVHVQPRNPRNEVPAQSRRALGIIIDLVCTVHAADGRVVESWIFEIEVSWDLDKIWTWALYEIAVEAEYKATARVAVFSPEPGLRERLRTKLLPRMEKTKPILIERDQIERITDYDDARRRPELTILGCLFHAHAPASFEERVAVFRAAWVAIQSLAKDRGQRYAVAVMRIVETEVIDQGLNELREQDELVDGRWVRFSDIERKGWSFQTGFKEGRAEAQCEHLRRSIVDILELRGFVLAPEQRERIAACESLETLERWYAAAKTAAVSPGVDALLG
jgi:hypothetical protein